jgi:hypothetical protein
MDQVLPLPVDDPEEQWTQTYIDLQPVAQTPRLMFQSPDPVPDNFFPDDPLNCWVDSVYNAGDHNDVRLGPDYSHNTIISSSQQSESMSPTSLPHQIVESDLMDMEEATSDLPNRGFATSNQQLQEVSSTISQTPAPFHQFLERNAENSYALPDHWSSMVLMSPPAGNHSTDQTLFRSFNIPHSSIAEPSPVAIPLPLLPVQERRKCPQCKKFFDTQTLLK